MESDVVDLIRPQWPPLRHVRRGWEALTPEERDEVRARVASVVEANVWGADAQRDALEQFFTFLAQVETIAIEIPLRLLPSAPADLKPLLRRQLVDEVFHSTLFANLAHRLALPAASPAAPLASAERLLDRIRAEQDVAVSATLLNLVAEGWIENLFRHALRWGIADAVFTAVLADEARHVEEAHAYLADGLDLAKAEAAVRTLEAGLVEVGSEPLVALAILDLAGAEAYQALALDLEATHVRHLREVGLEPGPVWTESRQLAKRLETERVRWREARGADADRLEAEAARRPERVPDTPWRLAARRVWSTPRDPTMQGDFDTPVGHVPRKLMTPVIVAALGRAWARNPRLNRVLARDGVWQLPRVNVGVRVLVADDELATVVVTEADRRSVSDIRRIIRDGHAQLLALRARRLRATGPVATPDLQALALMPPEGNSFAVALSNPGKFGIVSGAGSFSGPVSPSTDVTVGRRRRMPVWRGVMYLPAWHANFGCIQDHRVFDGREAGLAMTAIQESLSRAAVREILRRPDTLPVEDEEPTYDDAWVDRQMALLPPQLRMLASVGAIKYSPVVLGGLGLAAGLGAGTYALVQNLRPPPPPQPLPPPLPARPPGDPPSSPPPGSPPSAPPKGPRR